MKLLRNINSFRNDRKNLGEYHPWVGIYETLTNSLQSFLEMIVRSLVNITLGFAFTKFLRAFYNQYFKMIFAIIYQIIRSLMNATPSSGIQKTCCDLYLRITLRRFGNTSPGKVFRNLLNGDSQASFHFEYFNMFWRHDIQHNDNQHNATKYIVLNVIYAE